ncbi:tetratricopeptide repeat protein [uncultured Polaribacter sp.]|uniref:tetratricopeptide repeat protein n=1 Tax=uncultured Polaribacter sp. TaxID=174711 RepID=UPI00261FA914|nr:tetratricopeptide repeat protein [uncultured Polaribacter sp.]
MKKKILIVVLFVIVKVGAQTPTFSAIDSLVENGRYLIALDKLKAIQPPSFLANYKTALIYESIDNYKQTIAYLEKALRFKENKKASLKLAKAYLRISKSNKAITIYEDLVEKDTSNLILKYQLGKLYLKNRKPKKAIAVFKNLIAKDSLNPHFSYQLGLAYALNRDNNRKMNSFLDVVKKDSTHLKAMTKLASSYFYLKDKDSTYLYINKGLQVNPNHISLNRIKANQLYREKDFKAIVPVLLQLDSLEKMEHFTNNMLGKVYYQKEDYKNAAKRFKNVVKIDTQDFKAYTYLGNIALKEKNYKIARLYYFRATTVGKEKRDDAFYGLATMAYEQKKPQTAIRYFKKAFEENSRNYKALFQLARLSDDYYEDKKIAYKHYKTFKKMFLNRDKEMSDFVESRITAIKKAFFIKGESLE